MKLGTPLSPAAVKVMLLGSGELGKEVAIELQRLGVEVIAVDRYADAPAMQVAHRAHVVTMTDAAALKAVIARYGGDPAWVTVRPPLVALTDEQRAALAAELGRAAFSMPGLGQEE